MGNPTETSGDLHKSHFCSLILVNKIFFSPADNFIGKIKLLCIYQIHNKHKIYLLIVILEKIPKVEIQWPSGIWTWNFNINPTD